MRITVTDNGEGELRRRIVSDGSPTRYCSFLGCSCWNSCLRKPALDFKARNGAQLATSVHRAATVV